MLTTLDQDNPPPPPVRTAIADFPPQKKLFIMDGGFGSLLERLGYDVNHHELWSGGANIDETELVLKAHKMFLDAGAEVIMTNTYHCSIQKMMDAYGYSVTEAESVIRKAVDLAEQAILCSANPQSRVLVGAVGPYATYLRDASEYSGSYTKKSDFSRRTIVDYYLMQSKPLIAAGIRCLVFETIPTLVEVECLEEVLERVADSIDAAWVIVTCQSGSVTRGGDPFESVVRVASRLPKVQCVGVNCTAPEYFTELLERGALVRRELNAALPFVVYPNSGEVYNEETRCFEGASQIDAIAAQIPRWHALGARVIGGCCRVLPDEIALIARRAAEL